MAEEDRQNTGQDSQEPSWTRRLARHRSGLAAMSFAESTVVPIPLETIVIPLMLGHSRRALTIATAIWIGCLIGAALFYFVGLWAVDPIVRPALDWVGLQEDFDQMADKLGSDGLFWSVFLVSFSPAPMQLATLGAGATQGGFLPFFGAIALSRGLRYFGLAILSQIVGPRIANLGLPKRYLIPALMLVFAAVWGVMQLW